MFRRIQRIRILQRASIAAALVLALTVLAAGPASAQETGESAPVRPGVQLVVTNNNYLDVHVYGVRDGYTFPIGFVTGLGTQEFTLSKSMLDTAAEFRLRVEPVGTPYSYTTDLVTLGTGTEIDLTVANNLGFTTFTVK